MFVSRYTLDSLKCDVHMLKHQTRDIAKLLGLASGKGSAEESKDVDKLQVASGSGGKQSVSQRELTYLRKYADSSVTVAFGDRKLLGQ